MGSRKRYLYMKPRKPPAWWPRAQPPRALRRFVWVGVLAGSGWVTGEGSAMTARQIEVAKMLMRTDFPGARFKVVQPRRGICRRCGCTDDRACDGGCSWLDVEETLCSTHEAVSF